MSSRFGLTVDEALAQVESARRITDEEERRRVISKILNDVRLLGYHDGGEDERQWQDSG